MKKSMFSRGFTLIELLVVIAIIGILAAVVLASLNDARSSGSDAAIKQSIGNIRSQAEIVYNKSNFSYNNGTNSVCGDTKVLQLLQAVVDSGKATGYSSAAASDTNVACNNSQTAWAVAAPLNVAGFWCVDSTGVATTTAASTITSGTDYLCSS